MADSDLSARIAVYDGLDRPPRVVSVVAPDPATLVRALADAADEQLAALATRLPAVAVREVIENIIHARCADPVVTILDDGGTLLVSDRGPGIPDKQAALLPGFTTAGAEERRAVRGVGSGLAIAREAVASAEGTLEITDNLGGGTVVRLHVSAPAAAPPETAERPPAPVLTTRQLRALLLILELGPVGPTRLARELAVAASTAYRDLLGLNQLGLVSVDETGRREVTEPGLAYIKSVL